MLASGAHAGRDRLDGAKQIGVGDGVGPRGEGSTLFGVGPWNIRWTINICLQNRLNNIGLDRSRAIDGAVGITSSHSIPPPV